VVIVGHIVGVGFEPGKAEVRLLDDKAVARTVSCSATEKQVEQALVLRHEVVRALVIATGKSHRLLWVRKADAPFGTRDPAIHRERIFGRWDTTLQRLAQ
ncbi:MAG TPA: hypothetical protein VH083_23990, partial [Myxococcales bacterium]|nr:hypothetical protein [Myxococcales bacterium]